MWVNTETHTYLYYGSRFYGTSKKGKYVSEADAVKEGDRPARPKSEYPNESLGPNQRYAAKERARDLPAGPRRTLIRFQIRVVSLSMSAPGRAGGFVVEAPNDSAS